MAGTASAAVPGVSSAPRSTAPLRHQVLRVDLQAKGLETSHDHVAHPLLSADMESPSLAT